MIVYEDKHQEIESLLEKARKRWELKAIAWMDYEDVKQIIRAHLARQWSKWDQSRPFGPWCNRTIINQILNQVRNHYGSFCRPCLKCPHNLGSNGCSLNKSGIQESSCEEFKKWETGKKNAYDVKITVPLEDGAINTTTCLYGEFDHEKSANNLHIRVLDSLTGFEKEVYSLIFVMGRSDEDAISLLKQALSSKINFSKKLAELKKEFYLKAKEILNEEDILE